MPIKSENMSRTEPWSNLNEAKLHKTLSIQNPIVKVQYILGQA